MPPAAARIAATPAPPCPVSTGPCACGAAAASATITRKRESRWPRFKREVLELRQWPFIANPADAQPGVAEYFDYYNHDRLCSGIGYNISYNPN